MSESSPSDTLSWENLIYLADFFERSGERAFRLLGGEPTLHPEFIGFVLYLLERRFDVTVFTSGIMKEPLLHQMTEVFSGLPPERLGFVCNLNDPEKTRTPPEEVEAVRRFLRALGHRVDPGFNIYRTDFDLSFLVQLINEFGLRRTIRLGVAHPIVGKKNSFVSLETLDQVISRLFSFTPLFERMRIKPGLDCGFPLCRFHDSQLAWLYRFTGGKSDFGCGPVVDIGPDLSVWPCFPLSSFHRRSLFEFDTLRDILDFYLDLHRKVRVETGGIYEACDTCWLREDGICHGGCLAHAVDSFQGEEPVRMRDVYL
jgi:radical SAM protein with 4Fe4S-binding SPASM domain